MASEAKRTCLQSDWCRAFGDGEGGRQLLYKNVIERYTQKSHPERLDELLRRSEDYAAVSKHEAEAKAKELYAYLLVVFGDTALALSCDLASVYKDQRKALLLLKSAGVDTEYEEGSS
jgi:hypothetical protein